MLLIWIVKSNVLSVDPFSKRNKVLFCANARNVRLYYPYRQYTNLFIFRFGYLYTAYAAHYVYFTIAILCCHRNKKRFP